MTRLLAILAALLLPAGAWAQCNGTTYPNPVGGGVIIGNCAPAVTPLAGDLLLGFQTTKPTGQQTRAFSLDQIQTFVLGGGGGGGPFLPLTGGTITGTLGVTGTASFGTGSAAWITATGGASATLGTGGTGNLTLNLRSAGTGTLNIGGSAFSAVQIFPAVSNGGILTISQPTTASNLINIATSNVTTGGINFTAPLVFTRNVAYTSDRASTIQNRPFTLSQSVNGVSNNALGFGINLISTDYSAFSSITGARTLDIGSNVNAGSIMQQNIALHLATGQSGQPLTPTTAAWLPAHAYTVGQQAVNGVGLYTVTVAGTSAGSGGPTGTGGAIVDGGVTWAYNNTTANMQGMITADILNTSTKQLGGTANGAVGSTWAMVLGNFTSSTATFYSQANVLELDDNIQGSAKRSFTLALSKLGGQGSVYDYGLVLVGSVSTNWKSPIAFKNAVDPNGVAIAVGKDLGSLQTMAGFINCLMCSTTGSDTQTGTAMGGGGYILKGPNAQLRGNGDLQLGNVGFVISADTLTIDTTYQLLTAVGALAGGTKWTTGDRAADDYGNVGTVTAVAGVPTVLDIAGSPKTYVATASLPGGVVTWHPLNPGVFPDTTGGTIPIDTFTSASETYQPGTTLSFGTGAATTINIGRAASTTTITGTIKAGASTGVSCGPRLPTVGFTTVNGIVTVC